MDRPTLASLAAMILAAPAWMRLGLAVRDEQMRARAAEQLASRILEADQPGPEVDQLTLSL